MFESKKYPEIRYDHFTDAWEQHRFSALVSRVSTSSEDESLPRVEYEDIVSGKGQLNKNIFRKKSKKKGIEFKPGDILFGKLRPYLKNWLRPDFTGIAVGDFWVFRPEDTDSDFIYSLIQTNKYQTVANLSTGTKMPRSDWAVVSNTEFKVPSSVEEQIKIGDVFKQLDQSIALHQHKFEKMVFMKKALLEKMFPKKGKDKPDIRFEEFTAPWEERKLGDLATSFEYGLNAAAKEYDGKNKYLRITDINENSREFIKDNLTSPNIELDKADNYLLSKGDILFARTGASVGKTYRYRETDGKVYYAGFLIRARINESNDSEFIYQNTLTDAYSNFIKITSQRSGQPGVNAREYASFKLAVPSKKEQVKIGEFFIQIDALIALQQLELGKLVNIKKALLQKMFV
ncbi:restriction endonuclease subunit S [Sporosarcina oncorhynchi]|uniref:Restriction endonuclease subunit S n=1 Tax=Sporosarcina oncorhynchi TaxID=3056444 RepID=A0ABZ0L2W9_9BACL|nr:restriction endonuclease subunit S [Sporosarcina sp. T2O-4]WOV86525.1 restriction endonuclease subunit S [Sporosarcina sp. T2O-4]